MDRVVIVGGGVLGTMHALMARRRGLEVLHLERDPAPRRASVRNFGLVWVSGRAPGAELALALRSRALWAHIGRLAPDVGLRADGSLTVALDPAELAVMDAAANAADAAERGLVLLDPDEARVCNPALGGPMLGALWCATDAVVEPGQVLGAVRAHLERCGGYRFLPGRSVVDVAPGWVRDHTGERHDGHLVVLCPGDAYQGPGAQALGAPAGLRRCRLQMLQTEPLDEQVTTAVADGDSLRYYPAFRSHLCATPLPAQPEVAARHHAQLLLVQRADGALTIGDTHAYDEPFDFALDELPSAHLLARAEAILGRTLPPVRRRWAGVYAQRLDEAICHREELAPGVVLVTGAGGRGMTLAPALAEQTLVQLGFDAEAVR